MAAAAICACLSQLGCGWQLAGCHVFCHEHRVKLCLKLERDCAAWSVKVTEEYAAWFTALIKEDLASAVQIAQAVAALREEGPALGRPLAQGTAARLGGPVGDQGAVRFRPHPLSAAAARRGQSRELAAVVPAEHPGR